MPEMCFRIRWPNGKVETCYSPSLVVKDFFSPGESYPLSDFLQRSRTAFGIASRRVEEKYGFPCSLAADQLARIETATQAFAGIPDARIAIDAFEE
jgi:uncharacterized repeat protein (TIGR04042 family)